MSRDQTDLSIKSDERKRKIPQNLITRQTQKEIVVFDNLMKLLSSV